MERQDKVVAIAVVDGEDGIVARLAQMPGCRHGEAQAPPYPDQASGPVQLRVAVSLLGGDIDTVVCLGTLVYHR